MIAVAGALFAWSILGVVGSPWLLEGSPWPVRRPRLALSLWALTVVTGVVGAVTGLVLLLMSAQEMSAQPALSTCQACQQLAVFGAGWLGTAIVGGVGALVVYRATGMVLEQRRVRRLTLAASSRAAGARAEVVYLDTEQHVAACGPRRGSILVSTALRDLLSGVELRSVIEHERSHLRQRHRLLASTARLQRACLPQLACTRACERSVLLLIELAADDSAARRCGRVVTARALAKVSLASADPVMQLRATRLAR